MRNNCKALPPPVAPSLPIGPGEVNGERWVGANSVSIPLVRVEGLKANPI